ncbi:MAG: hypothetical protein HC788_11115 [Sphingopyxis sp.]|nr:hypothetical protein [Sphingopyxis sp.]
MPGQRIADLAANVAGQLIALVLRSPHAHAKIKRIDVSKALALPGVEAIATSADFPDPGDRVANLGEGAVNLRDLSKCIQGLTRATPKVVCNTRVVASLWLHECCRCFGDRLVSAADRATSRRKLWK